MSRCRRGGPRATRGEGAGWVGGRRAMRSTADRADAGASPARSTAAVAQGTSAPFVRERTPVRFRSAASGRVAQRTEHRISKASDAGSTPAASVSPLDHQSEEEQRSAKPSLESSSQRRERFLLRRVRGTRAGLPAGPPLRERRSLERSRYRRGKRRGKTRAAKPPGSRPRGAVSGSGTTCAECRHRRGTLGSLRLRTRNICPVPLARPHGFYRYLCRGGIPPTPHNECKTPIGLRISSPAAMPYPREESYGRTCPCRLPDRIGERGSPEDGSIPSRGIGRVV